jgi:hypothetical protein
MSTDTTGSTIRWIDSLSAWGGTPPVVLLGERVAYKEREILLHRMSAKAPGLAEHRLSVLTGGPAGPSLRTPWRRALSLGRPLHPVAGPSSDRGRGPGAPAGPLDLARGSVRLRSLKQAHFKEQGYGLECGPTKIVAQFVDAERALITDLRMEMIARSTPVPSGAACPRGGPRSRW